MSNIHDVAVAARVSATTVSRYLNNRIELPAETASRIDAAIKALDYRPNALAKRLSLGRSEAIGLVTSEIANPFFAELAAAVEAEATLRGYDVFMISTGGKREREVATLRRLKDRQVDGLIIMTNEPDDGTLAAALSPYRNVVLIDEDIPGVEVPKIFVENRDGALCATRHLIEKGHRAIAHIGGPATLMSAMERLDGFHAGMGERGLAIPSEYLRQGDYSPEFGFQAMSELLSLKERPTAVFAGSDYIAIGAIQAIRAKGLSAPADVSIVGFDDMPFADFLAPALTTIRQPTPDLGREGFRALLSLIEGDTSIGVKRLPVTLVERQSVAPPRC
ncbi:MAG: LacI family DNA-binding transcriptional regulator [Rhizobiaceae bacterium]|nr:LacI family DNA-binding transcriptional regulator [Rhizobiaceae bacterium]